jgi:lysozyme family protein
MSFDTALEKTLAFEGGYANNPADRGGETNHGITQRVYDAYRKTTGQNARSVREIDDNEVREIYRTDYWNPCNCDALPAELAYAVFDMAVNSGVWNAKIALQHAVHVRPDGVIGPQTVEAAKDPGALLAFLKERAGYVVEILQTRPSQLVFAHGWINRLLEQAYRSAP